MRDTAGKGSSRRSVVLVQIALNPMVVGVFAMDAALGDVSNDRNPFYPELLCDILTQVERRTLSKSALRGWGG
jgi:hypothetical protein